MEAVTAVSGQIKNRFFSFPLRSFNRKVVRRGLVVVVVVVGVVGVYGTHVLCGFNVSRRGNHVLRVHKRSKVHEPAFKGRHVMCVLSKSRVLK